MSEPMPGDVPAQQYGAPGRDPEHPGETQSAQGVQSTPAMWSADGAHSPRSVHAVEDGGRQRSGEQAGTETGREVETDAETDAQPHGGADGDGGADGSGEHDGSGDDDGPRPLGLTVEPTGHAPVDAQLRRLEDADRLAVSGHLEVYEEVHRGLRDSLTSLDRPAPGGPASAPRGPGPGPYPRS